MTASVAEVSSDPDSGSDSDLAQRNPDIPRHWDAPGPPSKVTGAMALRDYATSESGPLLLAMRVPALPPSASSLQAQKVRHYRRQASVARPVPRVNHDPFGIHQGCNAPFVVDLA